MGSPPAKAASTPGAILAALLAAGISFALAQTMVIPAIPAIAREYDASPTAASWVLTGFLLSASVATPITGKLGDLYGKRLVFCSVLICFALGSVVCALADTIEVVIAGRVVQGAVAGVFPLAFGIIRDTFPPERVAGGIGMMSAIFGIGGGIGLPLSGVVVDSLDLSWLFWAGVPALPVALLARRIIPPSPTRPGVRIDWAGALLLSGALVCLLVGVTRANTWGWGSVRTLGLLGGGLAIGAVWLGVESRLREPLIELRVLRSRAVAVTNVAGVLVGFSMFTSFLLIPQFAQTGEEAGYGFGFSVLESGLLMAPSSVTQLVAGPVAGRLGMRVGFRATLALGTALSTVCFLLLVLEHEHAWQFVLAGMFLGAGITFSFSSMANLIVGAVDQRDVGIATGINTITRTVGGAFGAAVSAAILASDTLDGSNVPTEHAYTLAFTLSATAGILALLVAFAVPRPPRRPQALAEAPGPGAAAAAPEPGRA